MVLIAAIAMAGSVGAPSPASADEYGVNGIAEVGTASSDSTSGIVAASANGGCASGNVAVQQGGDNGGCYNEADGWEAGIAIGGGSSDGFVAVATEGDATGNCEWFDVIVSFCVHEGAAVSGTGNASGQYSMASVSGTGAAHGNVVAVSALGEADAPLAAGADNLAQFIAVELAGVIPATAGQGDAPAADGGSWGVQFGQGVEWKRDGSRMRHHYASTTRTQGSGSYETHAHATLIEGFEYDGEQVFSSYTDSCATVTLWYDDARTCASPWQNTSHGAKWLLVSGHYFDVDANSGVEARCDGCIDWKWAVP